MANSSTGGSIITGGAGNNGLLGTSGNDTMDGGGGSDALNAGGGNDTLIYRLGENAGASDIYAGGSGIDTLTLQLTDIEWADAAVRAQVGQYLTFLGAASLNSKGELTNSGANNFIFRFPNDSTLMVQMIERLVVQVRDASGQYVTVDPLATFIEGTVTGTVTEDGVEAGVPTATGDLSGDDLNGPDDTFQAVDPGAETYGRYGTYEVTAAGEWTYTLNNDHDDVEALETGATLTDSFTVLALDGTAQLITVTINGSDDTPIIMIEPDAAAITENQLISIDVLANDSSGRDALTLVSVGIPRSASTQTAKGSASIVNNQLVFDPGADFDHLAQGATEEVTVSYTMQDEHGSTADSTATITVTGTNDLPLIGPFLIGMDENGGGTIPVLDVCTDVDDGDILTVGSVVVLGGGSASVVDNKVVWDPGTDFDHLAAGVEATVNLVYEVRDAWSATQTTLPITVMGMNDTPEAVADVATATEDGAAVAIDILANDIDVDASHRPTITSFSAPAGKGLATISGAGTGTTYSPNGNFEYLAANATEVVTLSYTISDEHGATSSSTVAVTITGANDAAVVTGADTGTVTESGGLGLPGVPGAQGDLLSTDVDGTADAFQEQITSVATATGYGSYTVSADGVWIYTLNNENADVNALAAGATLTDRFNVLSEDGTAKEVAITIEGANEFANHAPTDIVFTASDPGDAAPDGFLGLLATVDPDSAVGDVHTYDVLDSGNSSTSMSISNSNTLGAFGGLQTCSLTVVSEDMSAATITETFDFVVGGSLDDVLLLTENTTIAYGGAGADRIEPGAAGGQKDDWLFGQGGNDTLNGGAGDDWLFGGTGDDWLVGGSGSDMLTGGAGVDMFMFNSALGSSNIDTILDFSLGDKIVLSKAVFTGFAGWGTLPAHLFNDPILRFDAVLLYDQATGQLSYDSDGNHPMATLPSQLIAIIGGAGGPHPTLSVTDFLLL